MSDNIILTETDIPAGTKIIGVEYRICAVLVCQVDEPDVDDEIIYDDTVIVLNREFVEFDKGFVLDLNVYAPSDFEDDDATAWGDLVLFERDPSGKFLNEVSCDVHHDFKEGPILFEHAGIIYQINLRVVNDAPSED